MARNYKTDINERFDFEKLAKLALSIKKPNENLADIKLPYLLAELTGRDPGTIKNQLSTSGLSVTLIDAVDDLLGDFFLKNPAHFQKQLYVLWKKHIEYRMQKRKFNFNDIPQEQKWENKRNNLTQELSTISIKSDNSNSEFRVQLSFSSLSFTDWTIICTRNRDRPEISFNRYTLSFYQFFLDDDIQCISCSMYDHTNNISFKGVAMERYGKIYASFRQPSNGLKYMVIDIDLRYCSNILSKNLLAYGYLSVIKEKIKDSFGCSILVHQNIGSSIDTMIKEIFYLKEFKNENSLFQEMTILYNLWNLPDHEIKACLCAY